MAKKTPAKKTSKKIIKKAPAKKVATKPAKKVIKKVVKKSVKKIAKQVVKKPIAKKLTKKVSKKNSKSSLAKVRSDYSDITFEQTHTNPDFSITTDDSVSLQNNQSVQPRNFAEQIRANTKKDENKYPKVHMKCRRGQDKASHGQNCKSMRAYKISADGSHVAQFKCVDCGHAWSVGLGGSLNI
jgi:hypothetical protein